MRSAVIFLWLIVISVAIDLLSGAAQKLSILKTLSLGLLYGPIVVVIVFLGVNAEGGRNRGQKQGILSMSLVDRETRVGMKRRGPPRFFPGVCLNPNLDCYHSLVTRAKDRRSTSL